MVVTNKKPSDFLDTLTERYPALCACREDINAAFEALLACYKSGGKILLCGNGGSAADCDHIVGELMKGFLKNRPLDSALLGEIDKNAGCDFADRLQCGLPAVNLCAHSALLAAVSNDLGGDVIYAQQVMALGQSGDILIGISTSGNADNVFKAAAAAKAKGMTVIGLTGSAGGRLKTIGDITICAPSDSTPDIQELHLPIYHALCAMVEAEFFAE